VAEIRPPERRPRRRLGIRGRVVASFVVLLALAVLVSIGVLRQVGRNRIDAQVSRDLDTAAADLRVRLQQVQPTLGRPGGPTLAGVFDDYLRARPARGDQAYLAFVGGKAFAASAGSRVALQRLPAAARWATLATTDSGQVGTPAGSLRWLAVPVRSGDRVLGVLVATELLSGQQHALQGTIVTVSLVMVLVLAGACLLAWGAAGRALAPVRDLAQAARSVSAGDDLGARVPVSGHDEVSDLGSSFNGMLDRLQVAFDSQRRFLDGAAHELRTPITIVRGHVELLDDDPDEQAATIALVLDEMDRMDRLVEELRVLARSDRPDFLSPEPVAVADLVDEVGRKAEAMAARAWAVRADTTAVVRGDRQRLTQALLNLVDNAIRVTDDGDLIEIGAERRDHVVVLWVRDDGPGIAEADLATLFDRDGRTVRRRTGGTGLGLPIVAAIARAHGGRPAVVSEPGAGSRFELLLPEAGP
jgi:signal transduction histidine kinase